MTRSRCYTAPGRTFVLGVLIALAPAVAPSSAQAIVTPPCDVQGTVTGPAYAPVVRIDSLPPDAMPFCQDAVGMLIPADRVSAATGAAVVLEPGASVSGVVRAFIDDPDLVLAD